MDLFTFTEKIFKGKLHLLCSEICRLHFYKKGVNRNSLTTLNSTNEIPQSKFTYQLKFHNRNSLTTLNSTIEIHLPP